MRPIHRLAHKSPKSYVYVGARQAALRWHPDKNLEDRAAAAEMFKKVAEAYRVRPKKNSLRSFN